MSYHDRLQTEINEAIDALIRERKKVVPQWVTHSICMAHRAGLKGTGDDRDFWEYCTYAKVRQEITRVINKRGATQGADPRTSGHQLVLVGFERHLLQDMYVVTRDGVEIGVPIVGPDAITDDELDAKAAQYDTMAATTRAHADELRRFKVWRRMQEAG